MNRSAVRPVASLFLLGVVFMLARSAGALDVSAVSNLFASASTAEQREAALAQIRGFAEDPGNRRDLLRLAADVSSPDAQDAIVDALSHQEPAILEELSVALRCGDCPMGFVLKYYDRVGTKAVRYVVDQADSANRIDRLLAAKALGMLGDRAPNAPPVLHRLMRDADEQVAVAAIMSVKRFGPDEKIGGNALNECLTDVRREVRRAAIDAMPVVAPSHEGCAEGLLRVASSANYDLTERKEAIVTIGRVQLGGKPLLYLTESLQSTSPAIRAAATKAIAFYRVLPPSASEQVMASLQRGEGYVGAITALASATARHREAMPLVVQALSNRDVHIRREASAFLVQVARTNPSVLDSKTVHTLLASLKDTDPVVRQNIVLTVTNTPGATGDDSIRAALRELAGREENKRIRALVGKTLDPS